MFPGIRLFAPMLVVSCFCSISVAQPAETNIRKYFVNPRLMRLMESEGMEVGISTEQAKNRYPDPDQWVKSASGQPGYTHVRFENGRLNTLSKCVAVTGEKIDPAVFFDSFTKKYGKSVSPLRPEYDLKYRGKYIRLIVSTGDVAPPAGGSYVEYTVVDRTDLFSPSQQRNKSPNTIGN